MARTGRPPAIPGEPRDVRVGSRFSKGEARALDAARGSENRSDFVRNAVNEKTGYKPS